MDLTEQQCYQALKAKDARFDGRFFVAVKSTGIYCRPICPARTPARERCEFYPHAALAEQAGFRPCLRCRPELAPGEAPVDAARKAFSRIKHGALNEENGVEELSESLGISSRQLRRSVQQEFGVTPIALAQTQRLLLAKQLLTETSLPVTEIAFASGFSSLRRFNALFLDRYGLNPSALRKKPGIHSQSEPLTLSLAYRPPLAWNDLLDFLRSHALHGAEVVDASSYARTLQVGDRKGWLKVTLGTPGKLRVEISHSLVAVVPQVLGKLRHLLDLDACPATIDSQLLKDPRLEHSIAQAPGVRVPGCVDGFELAWRTVLGQQVSVAAATRIAGRTVEALGEPIETPLPDLNRLSPTPEQLRNQDSDTLGPLGWLRSRTAAVHVLADRILDGSLDLSPDAEPELLKEKLVALRGIGPWTAGYIAMRALNWSDGWPSGDAILKKRLGGRGEPDPSWRPWSSYAAMRLWYLPEQEETKK
ncbi:MAG: DNA-3-methyladenine glycosylase 2 family protein [Candidatus Eremiobacteraeota bacterium]|nr:DNA-3-methyladenine glycosylase 2 family protein [Candidatus Eremiobacteraeota bacterium]